MYKDYLVRRRILIFLVLIIIAVVTLLIRMGYVVFALNHKINPLANDQWKREVPIEGKRGNIYDRNGKLIVGNSLTPSVAVIKRQVKEKEKVANELSRILDCSKEKITNHLEKNVSVELIKPEGRRITALQAEEIISLNLDGVYVVGDTSRYYPYGNSLAHVLGFTGIDNQGICGIEYIYNDYLKGMNGSLNVYTDAKGNIMPDMVSYYNQASKGFDIYLTIDMDIQLIIENIINEAVSRYNPKQMLILVEDPSNGEILGMASYPSFSLTNWRDYDQSLYNRNLPIWMSYEPGSTFKIVTYSAGIEKNVFSLNEMFNDPGFRMVGNARIKDWKAGGHGRETFLEVLQNSCNPGFMEIGFRLGVDNLYDYIDAFGFGQKSGIDLLGEAKGIVFKRENVGPVELATSSFGQGNSVTPIQLVNAMSTCINGGYLLTPYVLKYVKNEVDDIVYENKRTVRRKVLKEETSSTMRYALECVSSLGTGRGAFVEGYRVGGKTGTAQKVGENGTYMQGNYILSFLGGAPMNDPKAVVYLAIDNPKNTIQYGGVVAAPMVGNIFSQILPVLKIKPDYKNQIDKEYRYYIDRRYFAVPDLIGKTKKEITSPYYYRYMYLGNGNKVVDQVPAYGEKVVEGGTVILYMG